MRTIIVLGSLNYPDGKLNRVAINRLDKSIQIFKKGDKIMCTGGWGKKFNINKELPHAHFQRNYLLEKGIKEIELTELALSAHTVDDALKAKEILEKDSSKHLLIITSKFHLKRAKLIFKEILHDYNLRFLAVKNDVPKVLIKNWVKHEKTSYKIICKKGLYY